MTDSLQANSRIYRLVGLIRGWHTPKKSMSQAFGDHPLTSQLVMFLRRAGGSFVFEDNDLERMLESAYAADRERNDAERDARLRAWHGEVERRKRGGRLFTRAH